MESSDEDKLFPPTPRRRQQARDEGRFPHSRSLASSVALLLFFLALRHGGHLLWGSVESVGAQSWRQEAWLRVETANPLDSWREQMGSLALRISPWLLLIVFLAMGAHVLQIGLRFRPERLAERWRTLWAGGGRSFSERWPELGWKVAQCAVVLITSIRQISGRASIWVGLAELPLRQAFGQLADEVLAIALQAAGALVALGLIDFAWRWWRHERSLWMSREELREEMRDDSKPARRPAPRPQPQSPSDHTEPQPATAR